jgi:hypothetical protein
MFNLEIEHPLILKVIHDPQTFENPCFECGKFHFIMYLVIDGKRNVFSKEGCMQEVFMCPSCFNFLFVLNPSKRGEAYH